MPQSKPGPQAPQPNGITPDEAPPLADPGRFLKRVGQVQWDHYYMQVAETVRTRANCLGAKVGAVLVVGNRIISTGFNGTPAGFENCQDGGCVRCRDRRLGEIGRANEASEKALAKKGSKQLDLCICVHAEANALLSGARFGNRTEGGTLYTTHAPCFACLKEAIQAGIERLVYLRPWNPSESPSLKRQYAQLAEHLRQNDERNFEQLALQSELVEGTGTALREPNLDNDIKTIRADEEQKARRAEAEAERKRQARRERDRARRAAQGSGRSSAQGRSRR